jgi:ParB family chromosome partitioning protein
LLTTHPDFSQGEQPDLLVQAEAVFAPKKSKAIKAKDGVSSKPKTPTVKASAKKETTSKKAA